MKKQYERIGDDRSSRYAGKYRIRWGGQFRYVRTANELRQTVGDDNDGHVVRRRRLNIPTVYDDINVKRNYGRSWKDFTRQRHQWDRG